MYQRCDTILDYTLQYGGDGRQYAAGGVPAVGGAAGWGYEEGGYDGYGEEEVEELDTRMAAMTADQRQVRPSLQLWY